MNMRILKIIGIVTMTIDHIGVYLLPSGTIGLVCRGIGRLAYPLFAFMIAEGFRHTHDLFRYWLRLTLVAALVEVCLLGYFLVSGENFLFTINVFLPLVFGLSCLIALTRKAWYWKLLALPILAGAFLIAIPYGAYGVLTILIFGLVTKRSLQLGLFLVVNLAFNAFPIYGLLNITPVFRGRIYEEWIQWFSLLAFIPLFLYNGERGRFSKWFFYLYYPLHLAVILGLKTLLELF
jgi:hypothetical protein